jgi:hypothetical protein
MAGACVQQNLLTHVQEAKRNEKEKEVKVPQFSSRKQPPMTQGLLSRLYLLKIPAAPSSSTSRTKTSNRYVGGAGGEQSISKVQQV